MQKEQISGFNWLVTEVQVAYSLFACSCEFQSIKQKFMFLFIKTSSTKNVTLAFGDLSDMKLCFEFMPGDRVRKLTEIAGSVRKTETSKMHAPLTHKYTRIGLGRYRWTPQFLFLHCSPSLCVSAVPVLLQFQRRQRRLCLVFFQNNLWELINVNPMLTLESLTDTSASSSTAFCSQEVLISTDLSQLHIVPAKGRSFYYFSLMEKLILSAKKLKKHSYVSELGRSPW